MDTRMQVSYHFKFDPAKTNLGQFEFPETVTRTITAGDRITPQKVRIEDVPADALEQLQAEAERLILEAHKTATALPPKAETAATETPAKPATPAKSAPVSTPAAAAPAPVVLDNTLSLF